MQESVCVTSRSCAEQYSIQPSMLVALLSANWYSNYPTALSKFLLVDRPVCSCAEHAEFLRSTHMTAEPPCVLMMIDNVISVLLSMLHAYVTDSPGGRSRMDAVQLVSPAG